MVNEGTSSLAATDVTIRIGHQNIRSLRGCKCLEIDVAIQKENVDILCISEHWLTQDELSLFNLDGFIRTSFYCRPSSAHGGAGIFLKNNISNYLIRTDIMKMSIENHFEVAAIELPAQSVSQRLVVVALYRPPQGLMKIFLEKMHELLHTLNRGRNTNKQIVIAGDFNINFLSSNCLLTTQITDLLVQFNMEITITAATRVSITSATCIDNIVTNVSEDCRKSTVKDWHLSDHLAQIMDIDYNFEPVLPKLQDMSKKRVFSEENVARFNDDLSKTQWDKVYVCNDVNVMTQVFMDLYMGCYNKSFPLRRPRNFQKKNNWITEEIKMCRKNLSEMYRRLHLRNEHVHVNQLKAAKAEYRKKIRIAKKCALDRQISNAKNSVKEAWKVIRSETGKDKADSNFIEKIVTDGREINDSYEIANEMNMYFANIASSLTATIPVGINGGTESISNTKNSLFMTPMSEGELWMLLKNMKTKYTQDIYGISTDLVKKSCLPILTPLAAIINASFESGVFPDMFKKARVIPLFKKGDKSSATNYRPVSVLPVFSKPLERGGFNRMTGFLDSNHILSESQFGFRKKRSTVEAINAFVHAIHEALDSRTLVLGIACDLSKAFDCVDHSVLLRKLDKLGLRGVVNVWLGSYLDGRVQVTEIVDEKSYKVRSNWARITKGVPQGSILGPLLFLLYVNDLPQFMSSTKLISFADDTNAIVTAKNKNDLICKTENTIAKLQEWFNTNLLLLNKDKTNIIQFKLKSQGENVVLKSGETATHIKFLGIIVDENLRWDEHLKYLAPKLRFACCTLFRLRDLVSHSILKNMYHAYFHSVATYGISAWGHSVSVLNRIFILQKYAIRTLTRSRRNTKSKDLFIKENILTIPSAFILEVLSFIFSNKLCFNTNEESHCYNTRNRNKMTIPRHHTKAYEKDVFYVGIKLFNHLPFSLTIVKTLSLFRTIIKKKLIQYPIYKTDDFFSIAF